VRTFDGALDVNRARIDALTMSHSGSSGGLEIVFRLPADFSFSRSKLQSRFQTPEWRTVC
jgi:hypothetical protein